MKAILEYDLSKQEDEKMYFESLRVQDLLCENEVLRSDLKKALDFIYRVGYLVKNQSFDLSTGASIQTVINTLPIIRELHNVSDITTVPSNVIINLENDNGVDRVIFENAPKGLQFTDLSN